MTSFFNTKQESRIIELLLFLIAMTVLMPYVFIGPASADDMQYALNAQTDNLWELTLSFARHQGRFHFLLTWPFGYFAYFIKNDIVARLINVLFILSNVLIVSTIIKLIVQNKWIGYLIFLISFVFISGKGFYNPIACYPMYFSGSFTIILLALLFCVKYAKSQKNTFRIVSASFFAFGIIFYETYLLYSLLIGLIIWFLFPFEQQDSFLKKLKKTLLVCLPYLLVLLCYFIAYFGFRHLYPSQYEGASVSSHFSVLNVFNAVLNFASGAYPLFLAFSNSWTTYVGAPYFLQDTRSHIIYTIISEHFDWIVKAIISGFLTYYFVKKLENIPRKSILIVLLIVFAYIYIPHIPLAVTEKYLAYGGFQNYVTTYFAFIAVMVCFTLLFVLLLSSRKSKTVFVIIFAVFISLSSIFTDYANFHTVTFLRKSMHITHFMSAIAKTDDYKNIPDQSLIYAPQLYSSTPDAGFMFSQGFNWSTFFYFESGKKERGISPNPYDLITEFKKGQRPTYFFTYAKNQEGIDQCLTISQISPLSHIDSLNQTILADSSIIYYYSQNKAFILSFRTVGIKDSIAIINNDTFPIKHNVVELSVNNLNYANRMMRITIKAKAIEMNSVNISNNYTTVGKPLLLQ